MNNRNYRPLLFVLSQDRQDTQFTQFNLLPPPMVTLIDPVDVDATMFFLPPPLFLSGVSGLSSSNSVSSTLKLDRLCRTVGTHLRVAKVSCVRDVPAKCCERHPKQISPR